MWIALWIFISAFIIGIALWSMQILRQQKRAWSAFARKYNYDYDPGKLMESPRINAVINHMKVALYTDVQRVNDVRGERYVTIIEITMGGGMPTGAVITTPEWQAFVDSLTFSQDYTPDNANNWKPSYIIKTHDVQTLRSYLTKERVHALEKLFAMKNSMSLFFFDEQEAVLRVETSDPLRDPRHIEKIMKRLTEVANILRMDKKTDQEESQE